MNAIRVLHVIPSLSLKHGGPSVAMPLLARALTSAGVSVTVATTDDDGPGMHAEVSLGTEVEIKYGAKAFYFRKSSDLYKFSWPLTRWLWRHIGDFDIVHIHALFSYASTAAAFIARHKGVPYVIRPLGVLNEWGMENRHRILKAISVMLIEKRILRGAAAIHYTSRSEKQQAERSVSRIDRCRSVIVPLPVQTDVLENQDEIKTFFAKFPSARNQRIILFISRIHQKKGIELLLEAFARIRSEITPTVLVIAGNGDENYVSILKRKCVELNIADQTIWTGFLEGEIKSAALNAATVFVLPSYSENFGIAAAEALAHGVSVIITEGVGLGDETKAAQACLVVKATVEDIANAVRELLQNAEMRHRLGKNGRRFAMQRFAQETVGSELGKLYKALVARH